MSEPGVSEQGRSSEEPKVLWRPSPERVATANLTRFRAWLRDERESGRHSGHHIPESLDVSGELYRWSVEHPFDFWWLLWDFCDVVAYEKGDVTVEHFDRMPGAKWFPQARLNFAKNLLRYRDDHLAIISWDERGRRGTLTYAELFVQVAQVAAALNEAGVVRGDRVAAYMANVPETIVAMLAAASLGAVWSSCSPDFGVQAAHDRLGQIEPRVLFASDGYLYNGKPIDCTERIADLAQRIPSLEKVVVVPFDAASPRSVAHTRNAVLWSNFIGAHESVTEIQFARLTFDHPLYILYSSGTTGLPKCMVHGAGGTLLQHMKELVLHTDVRRADRLFYFTTCGWMMWNWLVSGLATGATLVLYDGSPFAPNDVVLWDMAEQEGVSIFGTSAKYLALAEKRGVRPRETQKLPELRAILSTGSTLLPESYDYVYRAIKTDVCVSSISGGTDIVSCFALGNPTQPVVRGELQTRGLGMSVEVFDSQGQSVARGEKGELVCTMPFPSMPVGFWNDPDGARYRAAYFEHYPGVWRHGDWVELTDRGTMIFHGRSDATLNPGGVRIGTAEIYRRVEQIEEVLESVVVAQRHEGDVRVVLFVRLRDGLTLDDDLRDRIRRDIRKHASPHHVPRVIAQVNDIPRTVSGKISEIAVTRVIHGEPVDNRDALANPEALGEFEGRPELV